MQNQNTECIGILVLIVRSRVRATVLPDQQRQRFALYQSMTTDTTGAFHFEHIASGQYKLFAGEDVEKDAWRDPAFMRLYEANGRELSNGEDSPVDADMAAIRQF